MKNLVVVGNGMVGHHFLTQVTQQLEQTGQRDAWQITVIGEERHLAYDRVHLSEYFDHDADHLSLATAADYESLTIKTVLGDPAIRIDRAKQQLLLASGESLTYDKLVLATGSYPFVPPIAGHEQEHAFVYRTLDDLDAIRSSAKAGSVGVVIGGGLLGLEAANALKNLGLTAHVVEFAPRLMPVQLDEEGGELLKSLIEDLGVSVHTEYATTLIERGETHRYKLLFKDHDAIETDLIVYSAGIRPRDELARTAELAVHERGGVLINDACKTSDKNIYAIGEVACWGNRIFGLVAPGYRMAEVAATQIIEGEGAFTGADMSTKLKLLGTDVGSIGDAHAKTEGSVVYQYFDGTKKVYRKMVVSDDGKQLLGAVLVGDNSYYDTLLQYCLNSIELPEEPQCLILPTGGEAPALGADALPETATICSCLNVTKGDVVNAVAGGCMSAADVKDATGASTGCGGCAQLLKRDGECRISQAGGGSKQSFM